MIADVGVWLVFVGVGLCFVVVACDIGATLARRRLPLNVAFLGFTAGFVMMFFGMAAVLVQGALA